MSLEHCSTSTLCGRPGRHWRAREAGTPQVEVPLPLVAPDLTGLATLVLTRHGIRWVEPIRNHLSSKRTFLDDQPCGRDSNPDCVVETSLSIAERLLVLLLLAGAAGGRSTHVDWSEMISRKSCINRTRKHKYSSTKVH